RADLFVVVADAQRERLVEVVEQLVARRDRRDRRARQEERRALRRRGVSEARTIAGRLAHAELGHGSLALPKRFEVAPPRARLAPAALRAIEIDDRGRMALAESRRVEHGPAVLVH